MSSRHEDLRYIRVPAEHTLLGREFAIEVQPTGDTWLTQPERTWNEVDSVLEDRIKALQEIIQDRYEVSDNAARIMAYIELNDVYRRSALGYAKKIEDETTLYSSRKTEINRSKLSSGKRLKKLNQAWQESEKKLHESSSNKAETSAIQELLLRKAVMDIFSLSENHTTTGEPLIIQNFTAQIESSRKALVESGKYIYPDDLDPCTVWINNLARYLRTTKDKSLFQRFSYRQSPDLISTAGDCAELEALAYVTAGLNPLNARDETIELAKELGMSALSFLVNRASFFSRSQTGDKYPLTGLIHDFTAAVLVGNNTSLIKEFPGLIRSLTIPIMGNDQFLAESIILWRRFKQQTGEIYESIPSEGIGKLHFIDRTDKAIKTQDPTLLPTEYVRATVSPEDRITMSISNLIPILPILDRHFKWLAANHTPQLRPIDGYTLGQINRIIKSFSRQQILLAYGIEIDTDSLIDIQSNYLLWALSHLPSDIPEEERTKYKEGPEIQIRGIQQTDQGAYVIQTTRFATHGELSPEELERIESENAYLADAISNRNRWFVSPRGDRFSTRKDPLLEHEGIQSITFNIDKSYPREHKVIVVWERGSRNEFWLDESTNLLSGDHQRIYGDARLLASLTNTILKRLFFITSGLLAKDVMSSIEATDIEGGKIEYKRAHYRILKSTERRIITMESHSAHMHAADILENYGIDIFKETERRRAIGTLKPYEYLTFVKEASPLEVDRLVLPNELVFDPSLIK